MLHIVFQSESLKAGSASRGIVERGADPCRSISVYNSTPQYVEQQFPRVVVSPNFDMCLPVLAHFDDGKHAALSAGSLTKILGEETFSIILLTEEDRHEF